MSLKIPIQTLILFLLRNNDFHSWAWGTFGDSMWYCDAITGSPSSKQTFELQGFVWEKYDGFCNIRMREEADVNKSWLKPHLHNFSEVSQFLFKSSHIRRLQKQSYFSRTNPCISKVTHQCRWSYFDLGPHSRASYLEHQPKHASSMQPMR